MTTKNTYWGFSPRNFGNEYTIAVANTVADAESYEAEGYTRIDRSPALSRMVWRGDDATDAWVTGEFNGGEVDDRFQFARALRTGTGG